MVTRELSNCWKKFDKTIPAQGSLTSFFSCFQLDHTVLISGWSFAQSHANRFISMTTEQTPSDNEKSDMVEKKKRVSGRGSSKWTQLGLFCQMTISKVTDGLTCFC